MTRILAHRGALGHAPGNSLAAFREAARQGADGVELDVRTSADGVLMVHHDPEVPGVGPIEELGLARLREGRLANGEPIPTLSEALAVLPGLEVWIELKSLPAAADATLFRAIDQSPVPGRCAVHSFDHRIIRRLGTVRPELPRGVLSTSYPVDPVEQLRSAGANTLWQDWHLIDAELVQTVHRGGAAVIAWTVNDRTLAQRLRALGVDGLCGDFPERLKQS